MRASYFDHTNNNNPVSTNGYAVRLNGGENERFGLARSISVMPGDKITAEVYAKYVDASSTDPNFTALLANIAGQIAAGNTTTGLVVDGGSFSSSTASFPFPVENGATKTSNTNNAGPKAYLNWLVFDRDYDFILSKSSFCRLSDTPKESGTDVAHERLYSPEITIDQAGYVYIYLSNEEDYPLEVYFDDFRVEHVKSNVVQMDDYYPFGLTFNSHSRENGVPQNYLYNGKEIQDELGLDWLDYGARMYMPEIGRWGVVDPLTDMMAGQTPYGYAFNNPVKFIDLFGLAPFSSSEDIDDPFYRRMRAKEEQSRMEYWRPGLAKCSTCPDGEQYDQYRNASHEFVYDGETGVVYNSTGGFENGGVAQQGQSKGNGGFDWFAGAEGAATLGWENFALAAKNVGGFDYKRDARDWRVKSNTKYGGNRPTSPNNATIDRTSFSAGFGATIQKNEDIVNGVEVFTESYSVGWRAVGIQVNFDSRQNVTDVRFGIDTGISIAIFGGLEISIQAGGIYVVE